MKMPKAYSYRRFSSAVQEQGDSLRRQTALAEAYALKHGLELDTTLTLNDLGVSAFKGANVEKGALGMFVKAIDDGVVKEGSYLLVENLDRLSRQEVDVALEFFLNITRKGIVIVTLDDEVTYSKDSIRENWTKLIVALAIMAGAHEQSLNKSRRIGNAWAQKRANLATKRLTKMGPDWLRPTDDGWEVIEEKAAAIKRVYELHAEGYGKASIAKILNTEGTTALSDKGWHPNTVQKLLLTRTVIGEFQAYTGRHPNRVPAGDPVPDYYPRIIDEDLWLRAQRPKKSGGGKGYKEMVNVFRGLLKCPTCQGTITTYSYTHKGEIHRQLGCYNYQRGICTVKATWKYKDFLDVFLRFVKEVDLNALLGDVDRTKNLRRQIQKLQVELEELDRKSSNVAMSIMDDPSPTLNKLLRSLESERKAKSIDLKKAEDELMAATVPPETVQRHLTEATENLEKAEFRVKLNLLLRQLIDKIEVSLGGTGVQLDGMKQPDTRKSFAVFFRNGMVRIANESGLNMKLNFKKERKGEGVLS